VTENFIYGEPMAWSAPTPVSEPANGPLAAQALLAEAGRRRRRSRRT
jgi:hypothetical protein